MDDDEYLSKGGSISTEIEDEFAINSEEENNTDPLNDVKDPNATHDDDVAIGDMVKTFKRPQQTSAGFAKFVDKKSKSRQPDVHTRSGKSHKSVKGRGKGKSSGAASTSVRPRSTFNSKYFGENIIAKLDERKRKIIRDHGFGILLEYDGCSAPKGFVQWVADQVDVNCNDILVGGKVVPFSPLSVHLFLGLPIGGEDIKENYTNSTKTKFLSKIKKSSLPLIKTFGEKLLGDTLSDDDVFRYFMVVALSTFLCENFRTLPSTQYLGALIDVSKVEEWDWSKFVFDYMFNSISNYRKKKRSTIGGCKYFLAAYYLDFVKFGNHNELHPTLPRILYWKGSMINKFASYDRVSGDIYGKRPVKSIEDTCYAEEYLPKDACVTFRKTLDKHCGFIQIEDRDNMCKIFEKHHRKLGYSCPDTLVAKMFKYMHETHVVCGASDAFAKVESSTARVPRPGDDNGDDDVPAKYDAPIPSLGHGIAAEDVLDAEVHAGPSKAAVKEGDVVVGIDDIVENVQSKNASATRTHEEEASMTEMIESDGLYDAPATEFCVVSEATEILHCSSSFAHELGSRNWKSKETASSPSVVRLNDSPAHGAKNEKSKENVLSQSIEIVPSNDSPAQGTRNSKRKRNTSKSLSPDGVASRTRCGLSKNVGRSPLSRQNDDNARIGGIVANPIVVEEAPVQTSKCARKLPKLHKKEIERTSACTAALLIPMVQESEATGVVAVAPLVGTIDKAPGQIGEASSPNNGIGSLVSDAPCVVKNAQAASKVELDQNAALGPDVNAIKEPMEEPCIKMATPFFRSPSLHSFRIFYDDEDDLENCVVDPNLRCPIGTSSGTRCPVDKAMTVPKRVSTSDQNRGVNPCFGSDNVRSEETVGTENDGTQSNFDVETAFIRMASENNQDPIELRPLAAISPAGVHIDLVNRTT